MSYFKNLLAFLFVWVTIPRIFLRAEIIDEQHEPLYAGTILAFYAQNAASGRLAFQPYFFATRQYGLYNNDWAGPKQKHSSDQLSLLLALETGITEYIDFTLDLYGAYSHFNQHHSWIFGDTTTLLGFQILRDQKKTTTPDFRILIGETFPTGKYEYLNPHKNGTDSLGNGAYATSLIIVLAKTFYWAHTHPINFNINFYYIFSSLTKVHGFNRYGGTFDTQGKVKPGDQCITNFSIQYSLDRRWAIGTDIRYNHQNHSKFSGKKGNLSDGTTSSIGLPSSEQFSLAPCLEYSWSEDFSVTLGSWFTVAGRNSPEFMSTAATLFYYF
ncbi:MAG: hypothetical protein LVR00_00150 [Rhabdochlamydiaceae bacterium]|jgi:hypothetical protein